MRCHDEFLITQLPLLTFTCRFLIAPSVFQAIYATSSVVDSLESLDHQSLTENWFYSVWAFDHKHWEQPCREGLGSAGNSLLRRWNSGTDCLEKLWVPHPCKCWRPDWMGPWVTWFSGHVKSFIFLEVLCLVWIHRVCGWRGGPGSFPRRSLWES